MNNTEAMHKVKAFLDRQDDVVLAYFYGSRAEGFQKDRSDFDVAVLLDPDESPPADYGRAVSLGRQIDALIRPILSDVRELNSASPFFCFQVVNKGQALCSKDEDQRAEFEVKTRFKYFDLKPMYAEFNQSMVDRLKEGQFGVGS